MYQNNITYLNYFMIGEHSFREKVRFYDENPDAIASLYFDERIEIDIDYLLCLFELGRYERYLKKVDVIIEIIIFENIYEFKGENIYYELLFRKAACLFQMADYPQAKVILLQLTRMKKNPTLALGLYNICHRKQNFSRYLPIKAAGIGSIMAYILTSLMIILIITPFFVELLPVFNIVRIVFLTIGVLSFFGLECYHEFALYRETKLFTHQFLNRVFSSKKING